MSHFWQTMLGHIAAGLVLLLVTKLAKRIDPSSLSESKMQRISFAYYRQGIDFFLKNASGAAYAIMLFSVLLNLMGSVVLHRSQGLLFLDTIGTALSAFILGPWWGGVVGLTTNATGAWFMGLSDQYQDFGIVNCLLGIAWGYGAMTWRRLLFRRNEGWWPFVWNTFLFGGIAVAISSLSACFILYYKVGVNCKEIFEPNAIHLSLYCYLQHVAWASSIPQFLLLLTSEIVFNIPDKLFSAALAIILLHLIFPMVTSLDRYQGVTRFIRLSIGSHVCFLVFYSLYLVSLNTGPDYFYFWCFPATLCFLSYVSLPLFVPTKLDDYQLLVKTLKELQKETRGQQRNKQRKKYLSYALLMITSITVYYAVLYAFIKEIPFSSNGQTEKWVTENFGVLAVALLFFLVGLPCLYLLESSARLMERSLDRTKSPTGAESNARSHDNIPKNAATKQEQSD